jgi:hypothetical protein
MPDDPTRKAPKDLSRICLTEEYEVRYWSAKFGLMPAQLRNLVARLGDSAAAIARELPAPDQDPRG